MLEAVHPILKEMEGCLSTTVYLHVTVFSLERFSHALLQDIQQTWYFTTFLAKASMQHRLIKKEKPKYGSRAPQIPKPRNTSTWQTCKTGLEALLGAQQMPENTCNFSLCKLCPNASSHRRQDFRLPMIEYCFASTVSGAQEEFQAPSFPAEVEFCVLQQNCLVWKLEHSPMDVGWNGTTTSLYFKVYLDWL